jgi:hypothetical protein
MVDSVWRGSRPFVCPLGGHMYANGLLWHTAMTGAACMGWAYLRKIEQSFCVCSCFVCLLGAMPSPPPFASPSPMHCNTHTHCSRLKPRHVRLAEWVPPVSGRCPESAYQHLGGTGEAKWCPEASSRGDSAQAAEETRGRRSGAHTGGGGS